MNKRGFTLAEVLICIAIIAVVSAFGGTIMKKSTANAYKAFIKSGYENLYNGLAVIATDTMPNVSTQVQLQGQLDTLFDLDNRHIARNGVRYVVTDANGSGCFIIEMTVPQQKNRDNTRGKSTAAFLFNKNGDGYLVPMNVSGNDADGNPYISDLQTRSDLISFYQDDTLVGKNYAGHENNGQRITPQNYKQAACGVHGSLFVRVPATYAKDRVGGNSSNSWHADSWNFNVGSVARILDCSGIAQIDNPNNYSVVPYGIK